ncbi:DUF29 domain-containing protein [Gloeothece verrucosa]|uniref:DUF29 domain-containing protein n=1 Tax=Gloeothece verrucosa (strain PCC 7822) TaxID=497965 RepID=E0U6Z6_GLOV7|nr:DUF29 domain-containing protein [Gloeothece verrucosa]ADN17152.1 protein of unknown function DUF29 [Gloeothece verrucosa PCC 7822]
MKVSLNLSLKTLYEQDFLLWLTATTQLLREKNLEQVDYENLIEELESMGRSEKNACKSNLRILLMHLLKYQYQAEKRTNSWLYTIIEHRKRLRDALQTSPSLKPFLQEVFSQSYQDARELAASETGLALDIFPELCSVSLEEVLNENYLPN